MEVDADHSGGLMHFIGTNVPIYVHDLELSNALWCLFTKVIRFSRIDNSDYQLTA